MLALAIVEYGFCARGGITIWVWLWRLLPFPSEGMCVVQPYH